MTVISGDGPRSAVIDLSKVTHDSEWLPRIPATDPTVPIRWQCRERTHLQPHPGDWAGSKVRDCRSIAVSRAGSEAQHRTSRTALPATAPEPASAIPKRSHFPVQG